MFGRNSFNVQMAEGGFVVDYRIKNPDFIGRYENAGETYQPKLHQEFFSKTRIFADSASLGAWLQEQLTQENK